MPLTQVQWNALKASINANTTVVDLGSTPTQINAIPNLADYNDVIRVWYNLTAVPDYTVWRNLPMETVLNLITFASMTPLDAVPTTPDLAIQLWHARAIACQGKQFNLQNLTISRTIAAMKLTNYRAAMQDCLTQIPAGAAGALIAANWVGVRDAAKFLATNGEKVFATGAGTAANPSDLPPGMGDNIPFQLSLQDVTDARTRGV